MHYVSGIHTGHFLLKNDFTIFNKYPILDQAIDQEANHLSGQPELVKTVIPDNLFEDLHVSTNEPIAAFIDHLNIRMTGMTRAKLTARSLLFVVTIELGVSNDRVICTCIDRGDIDSPKLE